MKITEERPEKRTFSMEMSKEEITIIYSALHYYYCNTTICDKNSSPEERRKLDSIRRSWNSIR